MRSYRRCCLDRHAGLPALVAREVSWQDQTTAFFEHVTREFPLFTDVTAPYLLGLLLVKTGIRLALYDRLTRVADTAGVARVLTFLLTVPLDSTAFAATFPDVCEHAVVQTRGEDPAHVSTLLLVVSSLVRHTIHDAQTATDHLHALIAPLYRCISREREEEQRIQEEQELQVTFQTKTAELSTDEAAEEAAFRAEFPDFFADFQDMMESNTLDTPAPAAPAPPPRLKKARV